MLAFCGKLQLHVVQLNARSQGATSMGDGTKKGGMGGKRTGGKKASKKR
jgi:hypothetical protein